MNDDEVRNPHRFPRPQAGGGWRAGCRSAPRLRFTEIPRQFRSGARSPAPASVLSCCKSLRGGVRRPAGRSCPHPLCQRRPRRRSRRAAAGADQPLDPSAPLEDWPDLGVDWPDMEAAPTSAIPDQPDASRQRRRRGGGAQLFLPDRRARRGRDVPALLAQFRALSTLEEYRGDPANAAQIDRRARADAELLGELLRAYGYYDALVTTAVDARRRRRLRGHARASSRARSTASPRSSLPGLDAARRRGRGGAARGASPSTPRIRSTRHEVTRRAGGAAGRARPRAATPSPRSASPRSSSITRPAPRPWCCRSSRQGTRRFGAILVEGTPLFSADHLETIARFDEGDPYRAPTGSRICARRWSRPASSPSVTIRPVARDGQRPRRPRRRARAGADAHDRRRGGLRHRRGRAVRAELAAPQPAAARRRGHLPRRRRHARAARLRDPAAQQFHAPRPGAERPGRRSAMSTGRPTTRAPSPSPAASSGRPTSSGRRPGPGRSAPS